MARGVKKRAAVARAQKAASPAAPGPNKSPVVEILYDGLMADGQVRKKSEIVRNPSPKLVGIAREGRLYKGKLGARIVGDTED